MPTFSSAGLSAASTAVLPVASIIAAAKPASLFFKNMDCLQRNYKLQNNSIAQTAARCQVIKTFVDFIKREGLAQKLVDRQAALLVQVDIACDIDGRHTRALVAALVLAFFTHPLLQRKLKASPSIGQAGIDGGPATCSHF